MPFVKLDANALDNPLLLALPRGVRLLHIEALAWASRNRTGGAIPAAALQSLTDERDPLAAVAQLVELRMWLVAGEGWQLAQHGVR